MAADDAFWPAGVLSSLVGQAAQSCGCAGAALRDSTGRVWESAGEGDIPCAAEKVSLTEGAELELWLFDTGPRKLDEASTIALAIAAQLIGAFLRVLPNDGIERSIIGARAGKALDFMTDAVLLLKSDWTIEYTNEAFEKLARASREALLGRHYWSSFPQLLGTRFEGEARNAMATGRPHTYEEFSQRLGRWYQCRSFPCEEGLFSVFIDITSRKSDEITRGDIEEKLLRAQRMESLGTLAGGIAHDFNNILAAILGHAGMVAEEVPESSPLHRHMEQICIAGARARELVERILVYARGGQEGLTKRVLKPLVQEALDLLKATLPASVRLHIEFRDEDCASAVNPSEVQQIVMNLCTNAWQALPGGQGDVQVTLGCTAIETPRTCALGRLAPIRYAVLTVEDNGRGMPDEVKQRLFEPFFTTKPRGQGTGLGLHVIRGIVEAHAGAIDIVSRIGRGTRFSVYLPIVEADSGVSTETLKRVGIPGQGEHVAYVDDDPVVLIMVERLLEKSGFTVQSFAEPEEFLHALEGGASFDLLVTDFNMPSMNGIELSERARLLAQDLPVVVTTGHVSDELTAAAQKLGRMVILQKERSYEELPELAALGAHGFPENRFGDTGLAPL